MNKIIFLFVCLIWLDAAKASSPVPAPVLVELYTSQGCSSCPPADRFAGELQKRADVIVLSLPVTYWDRLGWKDSLASPKFTQRQRYYARARGERRVYTPQMVVDGTFHAVGSSKRKIFQLIEKRQQVKKLYKLRLEKNKKSATLILPAATPAKPLVLWRVDFIKQKSVAIGSGENGGRTVTYYNVAKTIEPLSRWDGKSRRINLKPRAGSDGVAVFLQENNYGTVHASASTLW